MYGQTLSMYKTLVDAYRTVLERMRENNLVLPMAMIMGICGGAAVSPKAMAADYIWSGGAAGPSIWDGTTANWKLGTNAAAWPGASVGTETAIFDATGAAGQDNGGTISVAPVAPSAIKPDCIQFNSNGYILTGGTITIGNSANAATDGIITVSGTYGSGTDNVATINSVLNGGNALTKAGNGTLILGGANTYSGSMHLGAGILQAGIADQFAGSNRTSGAFGNGSALTMDAGTSLVLAQFSNTVGSLAGAGKVTLSVKDGATTTLTAGTNGGSTLFSGDISDAAAASAVNKGIGNVVKAGGGTWTLAGSNTYTGTTSIEGGTLRATTGTALSSASDFTVAAPGTLDVQATSTIRSLAGAGTVLLAPATSLTAGASADTVFSGAFSGSGDFTKTGSGTMTLSGASAGYSGTTSVNNGTLAVTDTQALGSGAVVVADGSVTSGTPPVTTATHGELLFSVAAGGTVANLISSTSSLGTVASDGAGTLVFTGNNTYASATEVRAGTLQAGVASLYSGGTQTSGAFGVGSDVSVQAGATLDFNGFDNAVGSLAGAGNVNLGTATATITAGNWNDLSGTIGGTGSLVLDAAGGTQILSGNNTYSGGTTITDGTLQVGNYDSSVNGSGLGGTLGSGDVALGANGILAFQRNDAVTVSNLITGSGDVEVNMGLVGVLTLSNANTYTGPTFVNSGRLNVTGSLVSDVFVGQGAILSGPGSTTGAVTLDSGAYIMGVATGTGAFKALGPGSVSASGALILDGVANGTSGAHTIDVLQGADVHSQFSTSNYRSATVGYDIARSMNTLTYTSSSRTWNSVSAVWDNMNTQAWQEGDKKFSAGDSVLFNDTGVGAGGTRTVTVNDVLTPGAITFNNTISSYIVAGPGTILGGTSIVKNGTGSVVWDIDSAYSGTTTINAGTFRVGNGGTRGTLGTGDVTVGTGASLLFGRSDVGISPSSSSFLFGADTGDWSLTSTAITVWNNISGGGNVSQVGGVDNVVILAGNNTYTGATTVNSGQLWAGNATAFGVNSAVTVSTGATLRTNGYDLALGSLNGGGMVQMAGTTLTVGGNNANTVFSGQLNDVARNTESISADTAAKGIPYFLDADGHTVNYLGQRASPSTWVFSTTGSTIVEGSYLLDAKDNHKVVNSCWVDTTTGTKTQPTDARVRGKLWQLDSQTGNWYKVMLAPVDGSGWASLGAANLVKTGTGIQTLAGDNAYTGTTAVNGGTLQVGNGGIAGTLGHTSAIAVGSGATLAFNRSDNALVWGADAWKNGNLYPGGQGTGDLGIVDSIRVPRGALVVSGAISGTGTIRQKGTGTTTLTGDNSGFGGAVVVEKGTLRLGDAVIDTITDLAHPESTTGADAYMGNAGLITPHVHRGDVDYADGALLGNNAAGNTVAVNAGATLAFNLADIATAGYTETHAITGAGNVANTGTRVVTLAGDSTYTGGTTVDSTVIRYMINGPSSLNNLITDGLPGHDVYGEDAVAGATFKAGVATKYDVTGKAVSGAFGVKSVVTVNAGATLDLNGYDNVLGALNSSTTALTDGNARVKEYLPDGEVHAGTAAAYLGTAGAAVVNFYKNNGMLPNDLSATNSGLVVGLVNLNGATLTVGDGNKSGDYAGVLTGGGTLVKIGTGTQILSGDSDGVFTDYHWGYDGSDFSIDTPVAFAGDVHINGGTLQLGNGTRDPLNWAHGSLGSGHVNVAAGATFAFDRVDEMTVVNEISGGGNVRQIGTGTTNLSGNNSYSGATIVDNGILRAIGTYAFGAPDSAGAAIVNGGMLDLNDNSVNFGSLNGAGGIVNLGTNDTTTLTVGRFNNPADTYAGVIQGAGNLTKTGTGTQMLSGANTYTGATTVTGGGTLKAGVATIGGVNPTSGAFGVNSAVTLAGGSTLDLNGFNETIGSLSGGATDKVVNGSFAADSVLTITGTNAGEANFAGALADTTVANGAHGHKISLVKTGDGAQRLSGNYSYTGDTTVNGGTLVFEHSATTPAAISTGNLSLGGATVQFDNLGSATHTFASTTIAAGQTNQLVGGTATAGSWTTGYVDLGTLNYASGALDVSSLAASKTWIKISGLDGATTASAYTNQAILFNGLVTANGGQNLVATDGAGYLVTAVTADFAQGGRIYDPAGPSVNGSTAIRLIRSGWDSVLGTSNTGGQLNGVISLEPGVFAGSGNVYDVASVLNAYTASTGNSPINTSNPADNNVTLSIGAGNTLRLAAQGSIVSAAGAGLNIADGILTAGGADNVAGTINVNATNDITISSVISDNGAGAVGVSKVGIGTLTYLGAATYTGDTTVSQGTLKAGAAGVFSAVSRVVLASGATLDLNNFDNAIGSLQDGTVTAGSGTSGGTVQLGTGGLTLGGDGTNAVFSGAIASGASSNGLTKVGAGTQILSGDNTYVGLTQISGGTLQIGNDGSTGTLGSGSVIIDTGCTLAFKRTDAGLVVSNGITGPGGVAQIGTGTTTLSGNNTYTGVTDVQKGILQAGSTTAFGSNSDVTVASGAALALADFDNGIGSLAGGGAVALGSATLTIGGGTSASFAGTISGAGGLTKSGTGIQTLSGVNTYTGATTVSGGTLALDYSGGSNRLATASSLVLKGGEIVFENLGAATQSFASTKVLLDAPATPFVLRQTGWTSGVVDLGVLGDAASGTSSWVGSLDIQDLIADPSWIKTSDSRYASTLNWSGKATSGGERIATDSNGYFILVNTTDYSQGGAIGDPAGPVFTNTDVIRLISTGYGGNTTDPVTLYGGAGTKDVGGIINAYAAGTTNPSTNTFVTLQIASNQTLRVGSFGVSAAGAGTDLVLDGGNLTSSTAAVAFNGGTHTITVKSTIVDDAGAVGVVQNGGTTVLTAGNTYTGTTTVSSGILQVGDGGTTGKLGSGDVAVAAGGTLSYDRSDAVTVDNVLTGAGTFSQEGAGTTTLTHATGFTGELQVDGGALNLDAATNATMALARGVSVATGTTLRVGMDSARPTHVAINGASSNFGTVLVNANSQLDVTENIGGNGVINNFGTLTLTGGTTLAPVDIQNAITNNGDATMAVSGVVNTGSIIFTQGGLLKIDSTALINATHVPTGTTNPTAAQAGPAVVIQPGADLLLTSTDASLDAAGETRKIIHTESDSGGVSGKFTIDAASNALLAGNLHFFSASTANDVYLGVQKNIQIGTIAKPTPQQTATLDGILDAGQQATTTQNADIQGAIDYLSPLTGSALADAANRLTGNDRATMDNQAIRTSHLLGQGLVRFAQAGLGEVPGEPGAEIASSAQSAMRATALGDVQEGVLDEETQGLRFFMRYSHVTEDKDQQANGALASKATGNVFTVGIHNQLSSDWNIGLAFTYDQTNTSLGSGLGESDAKTYGLDAYFSHLFDEEQRWFIAGDLGYGMGSYDNKRTGIGPSNLTATSSPDASNFHVAADIGYRMPLAKDAVLTPYAGLSFVNNKVDAYAESLPGAPGLALSYDQHTTRSTETVVGADFAQGLDLGGGFALVPSVGLAWHHQLSNSDNTAVDTHFVGASGSTFNTYLGTPARDALEAQAGVSLKVPGGLRANIDLRTFRSMGASNDSTQNSVTAGLSYDF